MNGIHDMGGMQDMGPIDYEKNEPVFHARWESRVFALFLAAGAWRKWNLDAFRHTREVLDPADYLRVSYYEQWFSGLRDLLVRRGLVTAGELESGVPAPGTVKAMPPLTAEKIPATLPNRIHAQRDVQVVARFQMGIHWGIPGYRATREEKSGQLRATMVFLFFQTPMLISSVKSRSMFIRCALLRVNCGVSKRRREIPFTWICGMSTLSLPNYKQAQAFALAVKLSEQGHFTWKEWATTLADELKAAADRGEADDGSHYYEHWLAALERLVTAKGLSAPAEMLARKEAWADAYRHTPHGKPVVLPRLETTAPQNKGG